MRLHRFYINKPIKDQKLVILDDHLIHQWRNVFRYNVGSRILVFDGFGKEFEAIIEKLTNREAGLQIVSEKKGIIPKENITLYQSLIKKDKMEWVVEKATELGVSKIVPIVSERSEKKGFNLERAQKIAIEASEQCGRADVPFVAEVASLDEILDNIEDIMVFDPSGEFLNHTSCFIPHNSCLFISPEGGWSEKELEIFKEKDAKIYSLGNFTLRAETAAIVALTISKLLYLEE